jgi:acid phosphatase family membrane protein YuiD
VATGVELASAYVSLAIDGSQVDSGVRRALSGVATQADRVGRDSGKRMGRGISSGIMGSVARLAGPLAAVFAGVGVGKILGDSVGEAIEAQKVGAATDAIIKSTGGAAKVTSDQVSSLSESLSNLIGVDDELIQSSANLLLTFKNVRNEAGKQNDIFNQAVKAAADVSAAGFGSQESAAKMLGKALNDPVKGMSALGRAGVTFTEAQKKQIKNLVKNNDLLGAQKVILGEVQSQVGGVAAATATTADKVKVAWANVKERLGTALLPVLERLGNWFLKDGLPKIEAFVDFVDKRLIPGISGIKDILVKGDFTGAVRKAFGWSEDSRPVAFLFGVRDAFLKVKNGVQGLIDLLIKGDFTKSFRDAFGVEEDSALVDFLLNLRDAAIETAGWFKNELWPALKEAYEVIAPKVKEAFDTIREAFGGASEGTGDANIKWRELGDLITQKVIPAVTTLVTKWIPFMVAQFKTLIGVVKIVGDFFQLQVTLVRRFAEVTISAFSGVIRFAADMLDALSNVPGFEWAKDAADKLRGVATKADEVKDAINGIPNKKNVTIGVKFTTTGQVRLPNGVEVDMGVWKAREHGGPVRKGQPYVVGEKRPELFVPDQNGKILPSVPGATSGVAVDGEVRDTRLARLIAQALNDSPPIVRVSDVNRGQRSVARVAALSPAGAS